MTVVPSVLDDPATLIRLRATAAGLAGPFVDPEMLRRIEHAEGWRHPEWVQRLTGLAGLTPRRATYRDGILVALASDADHEYLWWCQYLQTTEAQRQIGLEREAARRDRFQRHYAWGLLRERIPVPVRVEHNWYSRGHVTGNNWTVDHIVVLADLEDGRLRRPKGWALCQTRAATPRFRAVFPNGDDENRRPTCKQCLRIAERWQP